jgi:glycogen phosphorylase
MSRLIPRFSATRAVRDYTDERYLPAAAAYRAGTASECAGAKAEVSRQTEWRMKRDSICFDRVTVDTVDNEHAIVASIFLGDAGPETVRV